MSERPYLSIGEVLGLLLEEFDDVTISKIRFLESQGLIEPERTPSGYRKFYEPDVERLKVILREQRENFLPLRIIRDRLENGTIEGDPTGGSTPPRGIRNVTLRSDTPAGVGLGRLSLDDESDATADITLQLSLDPAQLASSVNHPSAAARVVEVPAVAQPVAPLGEQRVAAPTAGSAAAGPRAVAALAPNDYRDTYSASDMCTRAVVTADQLAELESFGLVSGHSSGGVVSYSEHDLAIAAAASGFLQRGIEGRHLRAWRQAADREAALFEQLVLPLLRQRNPQSRQQAVDTLGELSEQGGQLRNALLNAALRQHLDG